jgi:hypothetical protein
VRRHRSKKMLSRISVLEPTLEKNKLTILLHPLTATTNTTDTTINSMSQIKMNASQFYSQEEGHTTIANAGPIALYKLKSPQPRICHSTAWPVKAGLTTTKPPKKSLVRVGPYDIICGRSSTAFNNVGNKRFRVTIALNLPRFMAATTKSDKSEVIRSTVQTMLYENGTRFLKRTPKGLVQLNERGAREKVGHALRDLALAHAKEQDERELCSSLIESYFALYEDEDSSLSSSTTATATESDEGEQERSLDPLPVSFSK